MLLQYWLEYILERDKDHVDALESLKMYENSLSSFRIGWCSQERQDSQRYYCGVWSLYRHQSGSAEDVPEAGSPGPHSHPQLWYSLVTYFFFLMLRNCTQHQPDIQKDFILLTRILINYMAKAFENGEKKDCFKYLIHVYTSHCVFLLHNLEGFLTEYLWNR